MGFHTHLFNACHADQNNMMCRKSPTVEILTLTSQTRLSPITVVPRMGHKASLTRRPQPTHPLCLKCISITLTASADSICSPHLQSQHKEATRRENCYPRRTHHPRKTAIRLQQILRAHAYNITDTTRRETHRDETAIRTERHCSQGQGLFAFRTDYTQ
jgi:hypothetical protein